jgi:hypothetical protein
MKKSMGMMNQLFRGLRNLRTLTVPDRVEVRRYPRTPEVRSTSPWVN